MMIDRLIGAIQMKVIKAEKDMQDSVFGDRYEGEIDAMRAVIGDLEVMAGTKRRIGKKPTKEDLVGAIEAELQDIGEGKDSYQRGKKLAFKELLSLVRELEVQG